MTIHYINKPIFLTLTERNEYAQVVCEDIVSFIHLVRLNIPAILIGGDISEFHDNCKTNLFWCSQVGRYVPTAFSYVPKEKSVFCISYDAGGGEEMYYAETELYSRIYLENEWEILLNTLKLWRHKFKPPKDLEESPIAVTTFKKRRKRGIWDVAATLNGEPYLQGDVEHTKVLELISRFPRLFAPSPKFKNKSETIFNAEDLPFEVY